MTNDEKKKQKRAFSDKELLKKLLPYLIQNKLLLSLGFLGIIIGAIFDVVGPYLVKLMIDEYIPLNDKNEVVFIGLVYFGVIILNGITVFLRIWLLSIVGENAIYQLRHDSFVKIQDLGMDYFDKTPSGEIMARLTNDLDNMNELLSGQVLFALSSLGMIAGMMLVMFFISPLLTVILFSTIPLIFMVAYLRRRIERPKWRNWRKAYGNLTAFMQENIAGARISLSFARQKVNQTDFEKYSQAFTDTHMNAISTAAVLWPLLGVFSALATVLILYFGGIMALNEESGITAGVLVLFMIYQTQFIRPVTLLTNLYGTIQTSFASYERIVTLQQTKLSIVECENAKTLNCTEGNVEFRNVGFSYKPELPRVLENFNLTIQPNECLALVGETGSGKTTIIRLLSRMYDFQEGQILIDSQDIQILTLESLRQCIGVVLQDPFLFSETIRYNLCYGKKIPEERLWKVLNSIGATFVYDLPNSLDTVVGEKGSRLSMGQRQLVAFARALVVDPKVLILDEATSSIDPQTELRIQKALTQLLKNRTSIIIAHRLSTVRAADRIIVLDQGKIVEEGSFDELLLKKGRFYEYYQIQF
ncbi:MAG: ABC transporter ATP-binding protein, partial [Candidatus Hodarchaeota archaeon]